MAKFVCQACKHEQPTGNENVGKSVHCPVCGAIGKVVSDKMEPTKATEFMAATKAEPIRSTPSENTAAYLKVAILLLGVLVVLQVVELFGIKADNGIGGPVEVEVVNRELSVNLNDHSFFGPMPVEIQNSSVPVDVQNSEVPVKLNNHYIISADPIPVEIVR
jgi:hypothetical protein